MKKALMLLIVACGCLTVCYRLLPAAQQAQVRTHFQQLAGTLPGRLPSAEAENSPRYKLQIPDGSPAAQSAAHAENSPRYKLQIPDGSPAAQSAAHAEQMSVPEAYINARERTDHLLVATAYVQHRQDVQVQGTGSVVKILPDDTQGSKHQRFILHTPEDVTVLIAHNIDLAPRLANLQQGDQVEFSGEYVWNEKGGTVHWTHRDPRGKHQAGWLKHKGATYQ